MERPVPNLVQQRVLQRAWACAGDHVIGIDEVGYGACAGPLVVAGVLSHRQWDHTLAQDSKRLTPTKRNKGYSAFTQQADPDAVVAILLASYEAHVVDTVTLATANHMLTQMIAQALFRIIPAPVILDGDQSPYITGIPAAMTFNMISADEILPASGAASVVAKVSRDHQMDVFADVFSGYDFKSNKGYLTPKHEQGLQKFGATVIHRLSYKPLRKYVLDSRLWQYRQQHSEIHAWTNWLLL